MATPVVDSGSGGGDVGGIAIVDKKGFVIPASQYEEIRRQAANTAVGGGGTIEQRLANALSNKLNDTVVNQIVDKAFGGAIGGQQEKKGTDKMLDLLLNSQFGSGLGQAIGSNITNIYRMLGPRADVLVDTMARSKDPNYVPPEPPRDLNRQLMERYDSQGIGVGGGPPRDLFPSQSIGVTQSSNEMIMSLSPDDPASLHQYMAVKGIQGVDAVTVRKLLVKEQEEIRGRMTGGVDSKWTDKDAPRKIVDDGLQHMTKQELIEDMAKEGGPPMGMAPVNSSQMPDGVVPDAITAQMLAAFDNFQNVVLNEINSLKRENAMIKEKLQIQSQLPEVNGTENTQLSKEEETQPGLSQEVLGSAEAQPHENSLTPETEPPTEKAGFEIVDEIKVKKKFSVKKKEKEEG